MASSGQNTKEGGFRTLSAPVIPSVDFPLAALASPGYYDPFAAELALNQELENATAQQLQRIAKSAQVAVPRLLVDIVEYAEGLEVRIDLAGVKKEDAVLTHDAHHLFISAKKAFERRAESGTNGNGGKAMVGGGTDPLIHKLESFSGSAQRAVKVGGKFSIDKSCTRYADGELVIFCPRKSDVDAQRPIRSRIDF